MDDEVRSGVQSRVMSDASLPENEDEDEDEVKSSPTSLVSVSSINRCH